MLWLLAFNFIIKYKYEAINFYNYLNSWDQLTLIFINTSFNIVLNVYEYLNSTTRVCAFTGMNKLLTRFVHISQTLSWFIYFRTMLSKNIIVMLAETTGYPINHMHNCMRYTDIIYSHNYRYSDNFESLNIDSIKHINSETNYESLIVYWVNSFC